MTEKLFNKIKEPLKEFLDNMLKDTDCGIFNVDLQYNETKYHYEEYNEENEFELTIELSFESDQYHYDVAQYDYGTYVTYETITETDFNVFCTKLKSNINKGKPVYSQTTKDLIEKLCYITM